MDGKIMEETLISDASCGFPLRRGIALVEL